MRGNVADMWMRIHPEPSRQRDLSVAGIQSMQIPHKIVVLMKHGIVRLVNVLVPTRLPVQMIRLIRVQRPVQVWQIVAQIKERGTVRVQVTNALDVVRAVICVVGPTRLTTGSAVGVKQIIRLAVAPSPGICVGRGVSHAI